MRPIEVKQNTGAALEELSDGEILDIFEQNPSLRARIHALCLESAMINENLSVPRSFEELFEAGVVLHGVFLDLNNKDREILQSAFSRLEELMAMVLNGKHITQKIFKKNREGSREESEEYRGVFRSIHLSLPNPNNVYEKGLQVEIKFDTKETQALAMVLARHEGNYSNELKKDLERFSPSLLNHALEIQYPSRHRSLSEAMKEFAVYDSKPALSDEENS